MTLQILFVNVVNLSVREFNSRKYVDASPRRKTRRRPIFWKESIEDVGIANVDAAGHEGMGRWYSEEEQAIEEEGRHGEPCWTDTSSSSSSSSHRRQVTL